MKNLLIAAVSMTTLLAPAYAADQPQPTTPGMKLMADETLMTENVEPMPAAAFKLGDMDLQMELTSLTDLQKTYGGEMAEFNSEHTGMSWLCYAVAATEAAPASLVWFVSAGPLAAENAINTVVVEAAPAGDTATCVAPTAPLALTGALPGVGASAADVTKAIPGLDPTADGVLSYGGEMPVPAYLKIEGEAATASTINYQITGGVVTARTIMQITAM